MTHAVSSETGRAAIERRAVRALASRGGVAGQEATAPAPGGDASDLAALQGAALAARSFGPWGRDPRHLSLAGATLFDELAFDQPCPSGLVGTAPSLNLLTAGRLGVVGVESKGIELLSGGQTRLDGAAAESLDDSLKASPWYRLIARLGSERFEYLDVGRLIALAIGLANLPVVRRAERRATLLYLYWEPENWRDFDEYRQHHEELCALGARLGPARVDFSSTSYLYLWQRWEAMLAPEWLAAHVRDLRRRYVTEI